MTLNVVASCSCYSQAVYEFLFSLPFSSSVINSDGTNSKYSNKLRPLTFDLKSDPPVRLLVSECMIQATHPSILDLLDLSVLDFGAATGLTSRRTDTQTFHIGYVLYNQQYVLHIDLLSFPALQKFLTILGLGVTVISNEVLEVALTVVRGHTERLV